MFCQCSQSQTVTDGVWTAVTFGYLTVNNMINWVPNLGSNVLTEVHGVGLWLDVIGFES